MLSPNECVIHPFTRATVAEAVVVAGSARWGTPPFPGTLFKQVDSSGDGKLQAEEVKQLLTAFYDGREPTPALVEEVFKRFDADHDGAITFDELLTNAPLLIKWTATSAQAPAAECI